MDREEAREHVEKMNYRDAGVRKNYNRHLLDLALLRLSLDKIEQRLDALDMKDDKRMRDIMHLRDGMRHEDMPGPCEYCGELPPDCECEHEEEPEQEYVTKAEYIAQAEQRGMTEDEAAAVFDECYLWRRRDGAEYYTGWNDRSKARWRPVAENAPDPLCGSGTNPQWFRLPLINGHLPELPVLACPDVDGAPQNDRPSNSTWQVDAIATGCDERMVSGPIASTEDAAIAHWNRWMRERFGASYGEDEHGNS